MRKHLTRGLAFEQLEDRKVLNGTVIANLAGGVLHLAGDNAANVLAVHQTGSGGGGANIQVVGAATKIFNGVKNVNSATFCGVCSICIDLAGGNDVLSVYNTKLAGSLVAIMGAGKDVANITNVCASGLDPLTGLCSILINGSGVSYSSFASKLSVNSSATGIDNTGDGADAIALVNVHATNALAVVTGSGNDAVSLAKVSSGEELFVSLGSGKDVATLVQCSAPSADLGVLVANLEPSTNGVLSGAGNTFASLTINTDAFKFRYGDLINSH